jgi:hypothetical protein
MKVSAQGKAKFNSDCVVTNLKYALVRGGRKDVILLYQKHNLTLLLRHKITGFMIVCGAYLPRFFLSLFHDWVIKWRNLNNEGQWCKWSDLMTLDYQVVWQNKMKA